MENILYEKLLNIITYCKDNLLSERQVKILELYYEKKLDLKEISLVLGISTRDIEDDLEEIRDEIKCYLTSNLHKSMTD